jgi:putative serine protease PepD
MKTKLFILSIAIAFIAISCKNDKVANETTSKTVKTHLNDAVNKGDSVVVTDENQKKDTTLVYKVSLGIMPDLAFKSTGVKVASVTKNRPGYYGGIKVGDIIVKIDNNNVKNLIEYTKLLGTHKKGDSVVLTVKRDGNTLKLNITFD